MDKKCERRGMKNKFERERDKFLESQKGINE
jgi:hypothetical protein